VAADRVLAGTDREVNPAPATPDRLRRRLVASGLASPLLSVAAGCAGPGGAGPGGTAAGGPLPAPGPVPPPSVRVGDRWTYAAINVYNQGVFDELTTTALENTPEIVVETARRDGSRFRERYASAWSVIVDATYGQPIAFETPMPIVPDGAQPGLSRRDTGRYRTDHPTDTFAWEQRLHVRGWQTLQVPAGAFECLRIDRLVNFVHPYPLRVFSQRTDSVWYAPQVNRWVQREWTGEYAIGPEPKSGRTREDWVRWQLTAYRPG